MYTSLVVCSHKQAVKRIFWHHPWTPLLLEPTILLAKAHYILPELDIHVLRKHEESQNFFSTLLICCLSHIFSSKTCHINN